MPCRRPGVSVPGEVEQQPVAGFVTVLADKVLERQTELPCIRVESRYDLKSLGLKGFFHLIQFPRHALQVRPAGRVITHADQQGMALTIETDLLAGLVTDQHDATLLSAYRAAGKQRQQDKPTQ